MQRTAGPTPGTVIVVGLRAEARLARRLNLPVVIGGGTAAGAETVARRAVADGATALLSFGIAGGLDPALRPGDLLVPEAVLCGGMNFAADPWLSAWLDHPGAAPAPAARATPRHLLGADRVAATVAEKRRLRQATGAAALDLESGAVARIAAEQGLPFAVLRAVCDPAERDLPQAALAALDQQGAIGLGRVIASVLARPGQVPALLQLARDAAAARRALAVQVARIGDATHFPPPLVRGTRGGAEA
jgi:adenosylhomocysteine nucleosidase